MTSVFEKMDEYENYDRKGESRRDKIYGVVAIVLVAGILVGLVASGKISVDISGVSDLFEPEKELQSTEDTSKAITDIGRGMDGLASDMKDVDDILG